MAERLTLSKIIRDLSGRPPEAFFGETWQKANRADIERARKQHEQAKAEPVQHDIYCGCADCVRFKDTALADTECDYELERMLEAEEQHQDDDRESTENLPGRG